MAAVSKALSVSDQALLNAFRAWGVVVDSAVWDRFPPDRAETLRTAWDRVPEGQPERAQAAVRLEHAAQARPDLHRVHPSWWFRGLQDETQAVRRAVVNTASREWRETLRAGLAFSTHDLETDHAPLPGALAWASSLWTERLVGDLAERAEDPPSIRILAAFSPRSCARLIRVVGLAKWAASRSDPPVLRALDQERFRTFREASRSLRDQFRELATRDVVALGKAPRHALVRLGAVSLARLLSLADPYRVRWALQHVPYPAAKLIRSLMPTRASATHAWSTWETDNLRSAWDRLQGEGRWPWKWEMMA